MDANARRKVLSDARGVVEDSGFETLRATFGQDRLLRIVLDREERKVTVDDATRMNLRLRAALRARGHDVDLMRIEIESPGADRALTEPRHFKRFLGERVRVVLRGAAATRRVLNGVLARSDDASFTLEVEGGGVETFRFADVAETRLDQALPF
jgi:ribosome maturation factor RimP